MAGSGPPPNPQSRKQTGGQAHTWLDLPSAGFTGPIPAWPLAAASKREREVWQTIWRTPQAQAWSLLGWRHDIAIYVRYLVRAEGGDLKSATEARQWSDRLGLNPTAMLKNRWRVRPDEVAAQRETKTATKTKRRLTVAAEGTAP